jgi:hypothetical protein
MSNLIGRGKEGEKGTSLIFLRPPGIAQCELQSQAMRGAVDPIIAAVGPAAIHARAQASQGCRRQRCVANGKGTEKGTSLIIDVAGVANNQ